MGNTWLGMYFPDRIRERIPKVEVVLRACKTGVPLEQRKEYIITKHGELGEIIYLS